MSIYRRATDERNRRDNLAVDPVKGPLQPVHFSMNGRHRPEYQNAASDRSGQLAQPDELHARELANLRLAGRRTLSTPQNLDRLATQALEHVAGQESPKPRPLGLSFPTRRPTGGKGESRPRPQDLSPEPCTSSGQNRFGLRCSALLPAQPPLALDMHEPDMARESLAGRLAPTSDP
ncbi:hypothetical protein MPTK1_2g14430 [Marchantia polymorpha subsp. ruderalis]|uniref:Uncharacterized protein n=1 Tax=Marchantia polymorpha TaxID=3197 RepID=A0A2R6X1Q9_MARPO|nr:hypothetical protein MARPO_0042s0070 [Marchantia polymorpha]BBN02333.1 hypothetical protein Mp_2g14430 [Marchantia polymorpha subsp. ruderalis]|eukprot:PTQ40032.1 hypothetical protein MARPO_0042s0070 [Marchantia polymorpha]